MLFHKGQIYIRDTINFLHTSAQIAKQKNFFLFSHITILSRKTKNYAS